MIRHFIPLAIPGMLALGSLSAMDADSEPMPGVRQFSIVPQIFIGSSGVELGVAGEFRLAMAQVILRPEVFLSEDSQIGGGASVLWSLSALFGIWKQHDIAVGPRVVYHHSDEHGLEGGALGVWSIGFGAMPQRHVLEILAAIGIVNDREDESSDLVASAGAGYAFRF